VSDALLISVISAVGLILSGVLVELIRARRKQDTVASQVLPSSGMDGDTGTLRDAVHRIGSRLATLESVQSTDHDRLIRLETILQVTQGIEAHRG
jgi:hypothetical protein